MSKKIDFLNLFKYKLNLNPWTYKNVIYIFGICAPRRWIWVLLEVCTTTRTKNMKRKSSVLRKLRQDIWRDKTFVRSCMFYFNTTKASDVYIIQQLQVLLFNTAARLSPIAATTTRCFTRFALPRDVPSFISTMPTPALSKCQILPIQISGWSVQI